jgi:TetR/AcrR family transcriptional repressor of nem operon
VPRVSDARDKLVAAATELIRRNGYVATSVEEICTGAGVTKGAFFHHFESKEALVEEAIEKWGEFFADIDAAAPYQKIDDSVQRALAFVDYFSAAFADPRMIKSCLAGTAVSEVSESNPALRKAAHRSMVDCQSKLKTILDAACGQTGRRLDTTSLAAMWAATMQGSFVLYKASRDVTVITGSFKHYRNYLEHLLTGTPPGRARS